MENDEITKLAMKSGLVRCLDIAVIEWLPALREFASLLQSAERERCAEETKKLRAFSSAIMEAWPEGGIEGDDLQEIACRHGMLAPEIRHEPCGEWCQCNGIGGYDRDDWQRGVECYRRTALLTGQSE